MSGTHLYTWVEKSTLKVLRLAQERIETMSRPRLETRPLDPELS